MGRTRTPDWRQAAQALGLVLGKDCLHPDFRDWAQSPQADGPWTVALSGGADSVALLLLAWAHFPQKRRLLRALHFDHRLRGARSRADAAFCERLCEGLGVALTVGRWVEAPRGAAEAEARQARFEFFDRELGRRRRRILLLGHQMDDVAETLLMRLSRGSGASGLAAPRPVHELGPGGRVHARPLLSLSKERVVEALRSQCIEWRHDESNSLPGYFRNRIRLEVLPRWVGASGRDALAGAALSRQLLEEDDRALERWVDDLVPIGVDGALAVARLSGKPRAVVRRALHRWLVSQPLAGTLSRQGFEALLEAVEKGDPVRHSLGAHGFARIRGGYLRFQSSG